MQSTDSVTPGARPGRGFLAVMLRLLLAAAIVGGGWLGYEQLSVEPEEAQKPPSKPRQIRTRVSELRVEDFQTTVRAQGILRPHNEVTISPRVSGMIAKIHPVFENGAFFEADEVLLELDTEDLEAQVKMAEAQVARAAAAFAQEETRAQQARLNWEELGYEEEPNDLVLRKPQLEEARASLASANAQLERARRDLERAKIRAPFAGRVRELLVGEGQSVGPGTPLGTIFAVDYAEVRLPISAADRNFLELPEDPGDPPVEVILRDGLDEDGPDRWKAQIVRTEGALDPSTLELFAVARIQDPFGRESGLPPLRIGQPVVGRISGRVLEDVVVIPREGIRELRRIYLVDPEDLTLSVRQIDPLWSDIDRVVVRDPTIENGVYLATTHLLYAPVGAKVELIPDPVETPSTSDAVSLKEKEAGDTKGEAR